MLTTISYPAFRLNPVLLRKMQVILTRAIHLGYDCVLEQVHGKRNAARNSEKAVNQLNL